MSKSKFFLMVVLCLFLVMTATPSTVYADEGIILPYPGGTYTITDSCHPDGWGDFVGGYSSTCAIDLSAGCGASIISPISGDMVAYADDGLGIGNTAAIIKGSRYTAFLLHGDYVASGPIQQGGLIGYEASHGNSSGCHTHISIFDHIEKKWVNPLGGEIVSNGQGVFQEVPTPPKEVLDFLSGIEIQIVEAPIYEENQVVQENLEVVATEEAVVFVQSQMEAVTKSGFQMDDEKMSWGILFLAFVFSVMVLFFDRKTKALGVSGFILLVCASIIIFSNGYSFNLYPNEVEANSFNINPTPLPQLEPTQVTLPEMRQIEEVVTNVVLELSFLENGDFVSNANQTGGVINTRWPDSIQQWSGWITYYAAENGLESDWVAAMMYQESKGNPNATSRVCATGLIQVMPSDGYLDPNYQCSQDTEENRNRYQEYYANGRGGYYFQDRPKMEELYNQELHIVF